MPRNFKSIFKLFKRTLLICAAFLYIGIVNLHFALATTAPPVGTPPATTNVKLDNPIKINDIEELLQAILTIVIGLATPIIVFFIIYAGFLYVTARGNPEQIKQASQALTYSVIGGVIILGSLAIATIVGTLVSTF